MLNEARRVELSGKFLEMGKALIDEGKNLGDYPIVQLGNFLILVSSVILADEDIFHFSLLCEMFTAKKVLEGMHAREAEKKLMKPKRKRKPKNGDEPIS